MSFLDGKQFMAWEDVAKAAGDIFNVWDGKPELQWAELAWQKLQEAGLTGFCGELERHIVLCRLLVLGGIYWDFCDRAWDQQADSPYDSVAEKLKLNAFILGRLYERLPEKYKDAEAEPLDALEPIVEAQRSIVVSAIRSGFKGDTGLYESLRNTMFDGDDASAGTKGNVRAYDWINQGCYSLR
jgi:hypothetical protein